MIYHDLERIYRIYELWLDHDFIVAVYCGVVCYLVLTCFNTFLPLKPPPAVPKKWAQDATKLWQNRSLL